MSNSTTFAPLAMPFTIDSREFSGVFSQPVWAVIVKFSLKGGILFAASEQTKPIAEITATEIIINEQTDQNIIFRIKTPVKFLIILYSKSHIL